TAVDDPAVAAEVGGRQAVGQRVAHAHGAARVTAAEIAHGQGIGCVRLALAEVPAVRTDDRKPGEQVGLVGTDVHGPDRGSPGLGGGGDAGAAGPGVNGGAAAGQGHGLSRPPVAGQRGQAGVGGADDGAVEVDGGPDQVADPTGGRGAAVDGVG